LTPHLAHHAILLVLQFESCGKTRKIREVFPNFTVGFPELRRGVA